MQVIRLLLPMLAGNVARDVVHRAGPVECDHGDDILEAVGLQLAQDVAHARTFQLEDAGRIAAAQHLVGLGIVERNVEEIELDAPALQDFPRLLQHRQRLQAEEIELHQPGGLDIFHVELRRRHGRAGIAVERHQLFQRPVADDDAGGVGRGVAIEALELLRDVDQPADGLVGLLHLL